MKAVSVHVGLNKVDKAAWEGWDGRLQACIADARAMQDLCHDVGIEDGTMLTDEDATRKNIFEWVGWGADLLKFGDLFVLTYSGHGGQIRDHNNDEEDGLDETWCLYDGHLLDDELGQLLRRFRDGVRVLVVADCCHSGTTARAIGMTPRGQPKKVEAKLSKQRPGWWARLVGRARAREVQPQPVASVITMAACLDHQVAYEQDGHGIFTVNLLKALEKRPDSYDKLARDVARLMPDNQIPAYWVSQSGAKFAGQKPFVL